ncbi:MAG TPA: acyl-CoA reductase [Cytophagales bacterium]|nr:acyl-CoA reductase [Cytophagales bacterium]
MTLEKRIEALAAWGYALKNLSETETERLLWQAESHNPWFTAESTRQALTALQTFLDADKLRQWTQGYTFPESDPKQVGIIMAGNIPLVGFHDLLSVLISGHRVLAKVSSQDPMLPKFVLQVLRDIAPELADRVTFADEPMKTMDAVIATGSNNSARYFDYYFSKYPNIIRKNRTSIAVLNGQESAEELQALGQDVFQYFGLGCRNVSKLFVPSGYNFTPLLDTWQVYQPIINHSKYSNNYDYHKSILLVNQTPHLDTGFLMLMKEQALVSPTSIVYYEEYEDTYPLAERLAAEDVNIQCLVGKGLDHPRAVGFGQSQTPQLWDYADGVDTLDFLAKL